ncbi:MAG: mechanosensitive ion channel family protein [Tannerella sp.]|jgi:MscS family membrane protein|nr:mechanosensitive ion channel family protein [Tannerella sp.]
MLEKIFCDNSLRDWGISLLMLAGGLILCRIILLINRIVIRRITHKSKIRYDEIFFEALKKPAVCGVMLAAVWVACERLNLGEKTHEFLARYGIILLVLTVTWFIARLIVAIVEESFFRKKGTQKADASLNRHLFPLIRRIALVVVWIVGGVTALSAVGIELKTLWGALGVGGIALALASQETVKNILGGLTIFIDRPFRIGDTVKFDIAEGTVEDISLRSTRIRTYDKRLVIIPNYKITDAMLTNITSEPARRVLVTLGLTYDTRYEQMQHALDLLKRIPQLVPDVAAKDLSATFSEYGDSALLITFIYFIRKHADLRETVSAVNFEILRLFNEAGLNFAFPTQTVYVEGNAPGRKGTG